jgi:hypothetical protein
LNDYAGLFYYPNDSAPHLFKSRNTQTKRKIVLHPLAFFSKTLNFIERISDERNDEEGEVLYNI